MVQISGDKKVTVVIQNGITTIGTDAFSETRIKKLTLPKSLTTIKSFAFGGLDCEMPTTVTVPKNVKKIGTSAFASCGGLKTIKVEKGNKYFVAVNGVLFNKAKTTLLCCPCSKTGNYTIPSGIKTLASSSFENSGIKELTVPASVTKIKDGAFYCAGFKEVVFEGHVPAGLYNELVDNAGDEFYIERITYPETYDDEWSAFESKVKKENPDIEWYYWYYE